MDTETWNAFLTLVVGALGSGGVIAIYLRTRTERENKRAESEEARATHRSEGEQTRETAMTQSVVEIARDSNEAMTRLAESLVKTNAASITQLATGLEGLKTETGHQFRYLREAVDKNQKTFEGVTGQLKQLNGRLTVVVDHLAREDGGNTVRKPE